MASFLLRGSINAAAVIRSSVYWMIPSSLPSAPWLLIESEDNNASYEFYSLADKQVVTVSQKRDDRSVLVGSSHGWLAFYKRNRNRGGGRPRYDLFLSNPLSNKSCVTLPPVENLPDMTEDNMRQGWGRPTKIILSSSSPDTNNNCRAIMSCGPDSRLAFCCPGRSKEWTPIGSLYHENEPINERSGLARIARSYQDFVYSTRRNQLLCVTKWGHFESWDLADPHSPKMIWKKVDREMVHDKENYPWPARSEQEYKMKKEWCDSWKYIVYAERSDRVFLVTRHAIIDMGPDGSSVECDDDSLPYKTVAFDVHELIVDDDELRYMDGTLDGMALFIGSTGHGFVIEEEKEMVKNNVEPDSIYFTDLDELCPSPWDIDTTTYGGHDLGIFDYKDKTFSPCYYPCDYDSIRRIYPPPLWFTPSRSTS